MMTNNKITLVKNVIACLLIWLTFSLVFPHYAQKYGLIKRKWFSWVLTFLSPAAWLTYVILIIIGVWLYIGITDGSPVDYDELKYISREDIIALTEIPDFPRFHYVTNSHSEWVGSVTVNYEFDKPLSSQMKSRLEALSTAPDNVFWRKGADDYILERGWDGRYIKAPRKGMDESDLVTMTISEKGFTVLYQSNPLVRDVMDRDSLFNQVYINFPDYEVVNYCYHDYFRDHSCDATLKLIEKPNQKFMDQLKDSPFFKQDEKQQYIYHGSYAIEGGLGTIEVNLKTGIIHCSQGSF